MTFAQLKELAATTAFHEKLAHIYVCETAQAAAYGARILKTAEVFEQRYGAGRDLLVFSAPGRTEVCGNHTDHQQGRVLAASVNLDVIAVAAKNNGPEIRVKSEGHAEDMLSALETAPVESEKNTSQALVRGVCACFQALGYDVGGFDAYTTSNVLGGSGLSSSAAFEVLIGTMVNQMYCGGKESAVKIAQIGQKTENLYFGKPCGLMDQAASSVGGFISIDFGDKEHPIVEKVDFDFAKSGYSLCIIDTKGNHADLTPDYAAIPQEMKAVAACFGKEVLTQVPQEDFYARIPELRQKAGDRAVLRAMHFYADDARVPLQAKALRTGDFAEFRRLIIESGRSSYQYLQNVYSPTHPEEQGVSIALSLCEKYLAPVDGAWRVHGGGFAGTVQTFVPNAYLPEFIAKMEAVLGPKSCHVLAVRPVGGIQII